MNAVPNRKTRSFIAALIAAVLTAGAPGLQGYQAFAAVTGRGPVKLGRAAAVAPRAVLPPSAIGQASARSAAYQGAQAAAARSAQAQTARSLSAKAKSLKGLLAAAADTNGSDPRGTGEKIQMVLGGGSAASSEGSVLASESAAGSTVLSGSTAGASSAESSVPGAAAPKTEETREAIPTLAAFMKAGRVAALSAISAVVFLVSPAAADQWDAQQRVKRRAIETATLQERIAALRQADTGPMSRLKFGVYATNDKDNAFPVWGYLGYNVLRGDRLALEAGFTVEPVSKPDTFLGLQSKNNYWKRAFFVGPALQINSAFDIAAGVKYRDDPAGYASLSFKFGQSSEAEKLIRNYKRNYPEDYEKNSRF